MDHPDNFSFPLTKPRPNLEEYEKEDKNILRVRVQLVNGEMLADEHCMVEITLSAEGMLGLGIELIRAAHVSIEDSFWEWHPSDKETATQVLGAYMHPSSCRLFLARTEFPTLDRIIKGTVVE